MRVRTATARRSRSAARGSRPSTSQAPAELRHGVDVRTWGAPSVCRWRTGGVLRHALPVPFEQLGEPSTAALATMGADAARRGRPAAAPFAAYLAGLSAPPDEVIEFVSAWWVMIGGTAPRPRRRRRRTGGDPLAHGGVHRPADGAASLARTGLVGAMSAAHGRRPRRRAADRSGGRCRSPGRRGSRGQDGRGPMPFVPISPIARPPGKCAAARSRSTRRCRPRRQRPRRAPTPDVRSSSGCARGALPHGALAAGRGDGIHWMIVRPRPRTVTP